MCVYMQIYIYTLALHRLYKKKTAIFIVSYFHLPCIDLFMVFEDQTHFAASTKLQPNLHQNTVDCSWMFYLWQKRVSPLSKIIIILNIIILLVAIYHFNYFAASPVCDPIRKEICPIFGLQPASWEPPQRVLVHRD